MGFFSWLGGCVSSAASFVSSAISTVASGVGRVVTKVVGVAGKVLSTVASVGGKVIKAVKAVWPLLNLGLQIQCSVKRNSLCWPVSGKSSSGSFGS